jgi:hypothetical protein
MRLQFDSTIEGDEEAGYQARDVLVERFGDWVPAHPEHGDADAQDVGLILDWKLAYGDGHLGRWDRQDIDELLLNHLPPKLSAPLLEVATIPGSIGAFAHVLEAEGQLDRVNDPAAVVAARAMAQRQTR